MSSEVEMRAPPKGEVTPFPPDTAEIYQDVLAAAGDLVAVVDRDLRYVVANTAHLAAHGRKLSGLVGRTVPEVMGAEVFEAHLRRHYERALAGDAVAFEGWFELRAVGRRYYAVSLRPRRLSDGTVPGLVIVVRDLTEREEAIDLVRQSRAQLALALQAARMGIWEWDVRRNVLHWSDEALRLFAIDREAFSGTYEAFLGFLHPDDRERVAQAVAVALKEPGAGDTYSVEYRVTRGDGALRWQLSQGQVLRDEVGAPLRMIGVVTDISRRKALEARLTLAEKLEAVGRLAGGVAHDFNNILTGVMGEAHLASEEAVAPSQRDRLQAIVSGCERAAMLTKRLLAFAQQRPATLQPTSLAGVIAAMSVLLRWSVGDRVTVNLALAAGPSTVMAAPAHVEQLVLNLVTNAREAMNGVGTIGLETREEVPVPGLDPCAGTPGARVVVLAVRDRGPGIDAHALEHLFEPFFTTREKSGNTGLGLATCYGIAEQLGGTIRVADARPGQTTFEVRLPATSAVAPADAGSTASAPAPAVDHVLLVEDDPWVRAVTVKHLAALGYRVTACAGGAEALQAFPDLGDVDLLLTDVTMPHMDGPELVARMRQRRSDLPVLLTSGQAPPEEAGPPFLLKPYTRRQLAEAIEAALARRA
jgi:two-component system, cell cycle sensor histidine kinase and response regulator CckA